MAAKRVVQEDLSGKTYLVTGATDGIGQHTATQLALAGGTVIVHGRNERKAEAAAKSIRSASSSKAVHAVSADLGSMAQIRSLASQLQKSHPQIHCLINNAGVFSERMQKSEDGFEMTWAVNVVAPFLLTALLFDNVTERIVNTSSISAGSSINWDNLQQERGFSSHNSYSLSKLAMMLFTAELAARKSQGPPSITCLDPGTVNTKMLIQGWGRCGIEIEDANYELFLATSPSVASTRGKYYVSNRARSMPQAANDAGNRRRLWDILQQQTGQEF